MAEELVLHDVTTGAGNDLERATDLARKMVGEWGMSEKLGPLTFGRKEEEVFLGSAWWNFHTGTTNVKLEGDVGVSYVYDAAVGPLDARDLKTGYTFCTNKGDNDLYINVGKELGALVTYTGNVYYTGNPYKVITTTLHTGKVIEF